MVLQVCSYYEEVAIGARIGDSTAGASYYPPTSRGKLHGGGTVDTRPGSAIADPLGVLSGRAVRLEWSTSGVGPPRPVIIPVLTPDYSSGGTMAPWLTSAPWTYYAMRTTRPQAISHPSAEAKSRQPVPRNDRDAARAIVAVALSSESRARISSSAVGQVMPIGPEDGVLLADRFRRLWQIRPRAAAAGLAGEKSTVAAALEVEEGFCEEFQQPCRHFSAGKGRLRRRIPSTADAAARGWHCGAGRNDDCSPRLPALQARWRRQTAFRHGLRKARRPSRTWSYVSWRLPLREICSLQVWGDGAKPKSMVDGGISTTVESRQAPAANLWRSRIAVLRRSERHIPHKGRGAAPSPCSRASVPSSP
ncbi:hypothetical protein Purlil1_12213 [Purpureocillium lilacinum]|uniref:Uncharacterized protein n=1 Tax=Purpureocillium lilacinum TaxID=33203 RepID=A0ABR0BHF5_PURLI|nr:hypothetical protein Purlil1_12213 [Purpureocillium lilacinum]